MNNTHELRDMTWIARLEARIAVLERKWQNDSATLHQAISEMEDFKKRLETFLDYAVHKGGTIDAEKVKRHWEELYTGTRGPADEALKRRILEDHYAELGKAFPFAAHDFRVGPKKEKPFDWRGWISFIFTDNSVGMQLLSDEEFRQRVCEIRDRELDSTTKGG